MKKKIMIQKITQNNGNFWTVNLIMRAKIVNQSSDFPVRRTGSYRHKKALSARHKSNCVLYMHFFVIRALTTVMIEVGISRHRFR